MKLSESQRQFLFSPVPYLLFAAGKGSGKTFIGARYAWYKLRQDPTGLGFIGANTVRQLNQVTLPTFNSYLSSIGEEYVFGKRPPWWKSIYDDHTGMYSFRRGGQIVCWSLEKRGGGKYPFDGTNASWFYIDETKDTDLTAFEILMERARINHRTGIQGRITTTPDGAEHWLYDYFADPMRDEYRKENFHVIYGSTTENQENLPPGYVEKMENMYDSELIQERRDGQFIVRAGGSVYHAFSDANIIDNMPYLPGIPVHIGIDFNVAPMSAVVCQYLDDSYIQRFPEHATLWLEIISRFGSLSGVVAVVDEIILMNSNTWQMASEIRSRYQDVYMYPDSSGQQRSTNSSTTDIEILTNAGLRCQYKASNPPVDDRINWVNSMLCNSRGKRSIVISRKAQHLMNDFRKVKRDAKGKIDKSNPKLTHVSDAFGYFISYRHGRII